LNCGSRWAEVLVDIARVLVDKCASEDGLHTCHPSLGGLLLCVCLGCVLGEFACLEGLNMHVAHLHFSHHVYHTCRGVRVRWSLVGVSHGIYIAFGN
jgi:hypothetical protein